MYLSLYGSLYCDQSMMDDKKYIDKEVRTYNYKLDMTKVSATVKNEIHAIN